MIFKAYEADLDREEVLDRLEEMAGQRRLLLEDLLEGQAALEARLSLERKAGRRAGGERGERALVRWLSEYAAGRTDAGEAADTAALLILLKFLEENAMDLSLPMQRRMGMEALSFLMPDRVTKEELLAWIGSAGLPEDPALAEAAALAVRPEGEALLSNLFHILEGMDFSGPEGRRCAMEALQAVDVFSRNLAALKGIPAGQAGDPVLSGMEALSERLGDPGWGKSAGEEAGPSFFEEVRALLSGDRRLGERLSEKDGEILRLTELMQD